MDIPDYIASSGAGQGAIKSMSDRMRSMGRKKRIRESKIMLLECLELTESQKSHLRGSVYSAPYVALPSHFSCQAQLDAWYSPSL